MAISENPFVGPRPFSHKNLIYGRDQEISELRYFLGAKRVVLLYSPSGAGKSSLLQARNGLLAKLRESGRFEVWGPARINQSPDGSQVQNRFVWSAINEFEKGKAADVRDPAALANMTLGDYIEHRQPAKSPILVFDQFEEVLRLDPGDVAAKREFFDQLGEALRNPSVWALLVLREDYLAALDPYVRRVPTHLLNRFRIDFLRREDQALDAIRKPLESNGRAFAANVAEDVLRDLSAGSEYVEPLQLQVVCSNLWEKIAASDPSRPITRADVGEISGALATYYRQKVRQTDAGLERQIREWFDERLITPDGVRNLVRQEAAETAGLPNSIANELLNTYLVRKESRAGGQWFELAHDRLVEPVRRDNKQWRDENLSPWQRAADLWDDRKRPADLLLRGESLTKAQEWAQNRTLTPVETEFFEQSKAAEAAARKAQEAAERELRQARRVKIFGYAAILLGLGAIGASYFAVSKSREALTNAELARKNEADALLNAGKAREEAKKAETNRSLFETEAKKATEESKRADVEAKAARSALARKDAAQSDATMTGSFRHDLAAAYAAHGLRVFPESTEARAAAARLLIGRFWYMPGPVLRTRGLMHAAFNRQGTLLVTASAEGARVWNSRNGRPVATLPWTGVPTYAEFRSDGKMLLTVTQEGAIVWDTASWKRVGEPFRNSRGVVGGAAFSPDNKSIAVASNILLEMFDIATHAGKGSTMTRNSVAGLRFTPDGRFLLAKYGVPGVAIFDTSVGGLAESPRVTAFDIAFNGSIVVSLGRLGASFMGADGQMGGHLTDREVQSVAFVEGNLVAVTSGDGVTFVDGRTLKVANGPMLGKSMPSALRGVDGTVLVLTANPGGAAILSPHMDVVSGSNPLLHDGILDGALSQATAQAFTRSTDVLRLWYAVIGSPRVEQIQMPSSALAPAALLGDSLVSADLLEAAGGWTLSDAGEPAILNEAARLKLIANLRQRLPSLDRTTAQDVRRFLP